MRPEPTPPNQDPQLPKSISAAPTLPHRELTEANKQKYFASPCGSWSLQGVTPDKILNHGWLLSDLPFLPGQMTASNIQMKKPDVIPPADSKALLDTYNNVKMGISPMVGMPAPDPGSYENPSLTNILMGGYTVPYVAVHAYNAIKGLATGAASSAEGIVMIPAIMFYPHINPYLPPYYPSPD